MKSIDKQHIVVQLKRFNCSESEADLYAYCLSIEPETIQKIAKGMGRNRTTVYSEVEQLLKKGLLFETRKNKKRYIGAENPNVLYSLLQQRENELVTLKNNIGYAVELLNAIKPSDTSVPVVKLYEGVDGFKKMLEETLSAKGEVLVFTYVKLFSELLDPEYLEGYFKRRSAKGIHTRLIFPPCDFANRVNAKADQYKIQVRLMPEDMEWKAGIFSWNDSIAIQSFTEGKFTCTVIENKDIAHFYRKIMFELVWGQARKMDSESSSE